MQEKTTIAAAPMNNESQVTSAVSQNTKEPTTDED
jgi:hypothetical protein